MACILFWCVSQRFSTEAMFMPSLHWHWRSRGVFFKNATLFQMRATTISASSQCVGKDHSSTSLAGRSANIAALLFLLVSFHISLPMTTSLPDMESGTRRVRPPMTRTRSDTPPPLQPILPDPPPSAGTSWPPLTPCALSVVSAVSEPPEGEEWELSESQKDRESWLWPVTRWTET